MKLTEMPRSGEMCPAPWAHSSDIFDAPLCQPPTSPCTSTRKLPSMGRPLGVTTLQILGGAYVRGAVRLGACRGVCTSTLTVPTPLGTTQDRAVVVVRDAGTTAHGVPPTSTATGHGGRGNPVPVTVTTAPPAVPTGPGAVADDTVGSSKCRGSVAGVLLWPPTTTLTATLGFRPGGTVHVIVVGLHCTTGQLTSWAARAAAGAHVRETGSKVNAGVPGPGDGGRVIRSSTAESSRGSAQCVGPKSRPVMVSEPPWVGRVLGAMDRR
jgi:hypothetical protein